MADETKFDFKKTPTYKATKKPQIITRPSLFALTISGTGDPNQAGFQTDIQAMYAFAYGIKMAYKKMMANDIFGSLEADEPINDYVVPPLAGYWTISEEAQSLGAWEKSDLVYQLELVIPDAVPLDFIHERMEAIKAEKLDENPRVNDVVLATLPAATVAHILHVGPYDDEPATFDKMEAFITAEGYRRTSKEHREIYLSDTRRTAPEKLKTILEVNISKS